jgi:hypothetical protein
MDLEASAVATRYVGEGRLQRLLCIAKHPSSERSLAESALKMAHMYAMQDGNVRRYAETYHVQQKDPQQQQQPHPGEDTITTSVVLPAVDPAWITQQGNQNRTARDVLLQRLSAAQAHLNKEAIRVAYLALAEHDQATGEVNDAFHSAARAADYCTNRQQTVAVSLQILQSCIHLQTYKTVADYTTKLAHTIVTTASSSAADAAVRYKVLVASGLERLAARDYAVAAQKFVDALYCVSSAQSTPSAGDNEGGSVVADSEVIGWNAVLAPDDVTLYAAFLSLAAAESREKLVDLVEHPEAFELVPRAYESLLLFAQRASYQQAWAILEESVFPVLQVDLYMSMHLAALKQKVREKALLQYWRAYQRVELSVLAAQMGPGILPAEKVEDILTELIRRPTNGFPSDTRIDLQSNSLVRFEIPPEEERLRQTQRKLTQVTNRVLDDTYSMIIRLACIEHNLNGTDTTARKRRGGRGGGVAHGGPSFADRGVILMDDSDGDDFAMNDDEMQLAEIDMDEMNPEDLH